MSIEARSEKEKGNAAYKKKHFETALQHYNKAQELEPNNIIFLNNQAAVHYEQGEYEKCIEVCLKAVEVGREHRADFKLVAKALARQGNAMVRMDKLSEALACFNKSLTEHRQADVLKKAQEVEKLLKERERLLLINPELSLEEKKKGNDFFTKGNYPEAMKHYSEAITRNPSDAKLFSNRAACYMKLLEFPMAVRDCQECIKLEPLFVKGHLRKGSCHMAMKENERAVECFQKALDLDPQCLEARDGYRSALKEGGGMEQMRRRAVQNPEVQEILRDPAMQLILQQMEKDPSALKEHLQNPQIAKKIEKLLESGILSIR